MELMNGGGDGDRGIAENILLSLVYMFVCPEDRLTASVYQ